MPEIAESYPAVGLSPVRYEFYSLATVCLKRVVVIAVVVFLSTKTFEYEEGTKLLDLSCGKLESEFGVELTVKQQNTNTKKRPV